MSKAIKKETNVDVVIVNPPPEMKIVNFSSRGKKEKESKGKAKGN